VLEKLGEGGMGEVYEAEDTTLRRRVALKVLPSDVASSQERLERFQREAESLASLNHPNIVHVYSVEKDGDVHFLTMELVEGENLGQVIPSEGLPLDQFFDLAIRLADALSEAHEQGIVHRDLKPNNIMVDRKGRPKILDFGLAKLRRAESPEDMSQLATEVMTQEGRVLGTYPYMSPEQVEGKSADHRSDLFSFGTVLYEMATGGRPFTGDSPVSLMSSILRDSPPDVDLQREELPHHLSRIVGRCLAKDPEDRYQRAKDLAKDLEELRQEAQTGVLGVPRRTETPITERRWKRSTVLGVLSLLVVTGALFLLKPWERTAPSTPEPLVTSLAVLPLANLSGDPELDYYAAGITEGLISELGRVGALRVISRRSVMRYLDSDKTLPEIAAELGVEALIEGSALPAGDRVRVTAQLIRADPEEQLWAETYERDSKDILTLLRDVTGAIVQEVQGAISPEQQARQLASREVNPEAHRLYFKALQADLVGTPESSLKAVEHLRQAVAIDPEFAEAWVELASQLAWQAVLHLPINSVTERAAAVEEAWMALERALTLDESLSLAHSVQGFLYANLDWDWGRAEQAHLRAIELNPNSADAHTYYARHLVALGRSDEALEHTAMAELLDPFSSSVLLAIGIVHYWAHDFERSLQYLDRALELTPGKNEIIAMKGWAYSAAGMDEDAVRAWQQMQSNLGNFGMAAAFEGLSLGEVNRAWLDFALSLDRPFFSPADIATAYGQLDEYEKALEWLEKAYATKDDPGETAGWRFVFVKIDPNLKGLYSDRRFQDLLRRMNLAD